MKITLALDSGAHSIYHKFAVKKDGWQDKVSSSTRDKVARNYDFYASTAFDEYLSTYVDFIKTNQQQLDFYVTIDAIFNPELSWQNYLLLRNAGLNPLPVLHPGEDIKWLKLYLEHTNYVGLGGVGQEWVRQKYYSWAQDIFRYIGTQTDIRVHGFAMTSLPLVRDLPWFSVDSTTPWYMGRCGTLLIPKTEPRRNGVISFNYLAPHTHMPITALRARGDKSHINHLPREERAVLDEYLSIFGLTLEQAQSHWEIRSFINYYRMHMLEKAITAKLRPFRYYMSGVRHAGWPEVYFDKCKLVGINTVHYLGTHYDRKQVDQLLLYMDGKEQKQSKRKRMVPALTAIAGRTTGEKL